MVDKKKKFDLEQQTWYHGFRPRKDVNRLLKNPGEFLVRASDMGRARPDIIITAMNDRRGLINLTIRFDEDEKKWHLGVLKEREKEKQKKIPRFESVAELVDYYTDHKLPGHAKLTYPINRPLWFLKHDLITFDRKKDLLGTGNFCHVYKGTLQRKPDDKITIAVKICHEGHTSDADFEEGKEARNKMMGEAQIMSFYEHQYVVKLFGVACDHPPILIVMEFCPGGDLEHHLKKNGTKIEAAERIVYACEASKGMRYLHSNKCVHRDLAARNVLISARGTLKIADFGLSKIISDLESKSRTQDVDDPDPQFPIRGMAPESLRKPMQFSKASDVWSYGTLLYEIFSNGLKIYQDDHPKKVATNIRRGNMPAMPAGTPQKIIDLVSEIWRIDPAKRPEMNDICKTLTKILKQNPPPKAADFAINLIPGVARTTKEASELLMEEDESYGTEEKDANKDPEVEEPSKTGSKLKKRAKTRATATATITVTPPMSNTPRTSAIQARANSSATPIKAKPRASATSIQPQEPSPTPSPTST